MARNRIEPGQYHSGECPDCGRKSALARHGKAPFRPDRDMLKSCIQEVIGRAHPVSIKSWKPDPNDPTQRVYTADDGHMAKCEGCYQVTAKMYWLSLDGTALTAAMCKKCLDTYSSKLENDSGHMTPYVLYSVSTSMVAMKRLLAAAPSLAANATSSPEQIEVSDLDLF